MRGKYCKKRCCRSLGTLHEEVEFFPRKNAYSVGPAPEDLACTGRFEVFGKKNLHMGVGPHLICGPENEHFIFI